MPPPFVVQAAGHLLHSSFTPSAKVAGSFRLVLHSGALRRSLPPVRPCVVGRSCRESDHVVAVAITVPVHSVHHVDIVVVVPDGLEYGPASLGLFGRLLAAMYLDLPFEVRSWAQSLDARAQHRTRTGLVRYCASGRVPRKYAYGGKNESYRVLALAKPNA